MKNLLAPAQAGVLARFAEGPVLLAFDFDGTLAPIVADRTRARMRRSTARLLARLAVLCPCAVISGRSRADLRERLGDVRVRHLIGNHGLEPSRMLREARRITAETKRRLLPAAASLPRVEVEDKTFSLALHYRNAKRKAAARRALLAAVAELPKTMRLVAGKDVLNLVPANAPHKGQALRELQRRERAVTTLYIGDDVTDEDVFRARWKGKLVGGRVGRDTTSAAGYFLRAQRDIDRLLARLIALREDERKLAPRREMEANLEPPLAFLKSLWQLNHALERLSSRMQTTLGVTAQQRGVLRLVGQIPDLTATALSTLLHLDPGTISSALGRLERKGLLTRRRDRGDGRRATLHLTARAASVNRPHPLTVEAAVERLLKGSSPRERRVAGALLEKLTAELEAAANARPAVRRRPARGKNHGRADVGRGERQSFKVTKRVPPA